jgi:hypothetical protein
MYTHATSESCGRFHGCPQADVGLALAGKAAFLTVKMY